MRRRVYAVLEQGDGAGGASLALNRFLILLIVVTLTATVIESVPEMARTYALPLSVIEWTATLVFSLEYAARIWCAVEHPLLKRGAVLGRLRFALSFSGLIDLAAILPFWLSIFIASDFRILLVLRLVRFFKLTRYSPAMRSLLDALYSERRALSGCFVILLGTALIAAALMHLAERAAQPERFGTIPDALWWSIVTLGTIGYGDVVPVTVLGRVLAGFTIFAGLLMMALPVGIFATAFANEVHRRDFIITWGLVARIPLFRALTASEIADVMTMLRAQKVDAGTVIARRGEPAHAMYLIADGEVEVKLRHKHLQLGTGQFFGEIAALRRTHRSATVTAVTTTRLLVLDALDLHALMDRQPALAARIEEAAREKLGHAIDEPDSDLMSEELTHEPGGSGDQVQSP
ncbi:cyclic nucleotide-gated ion channel [Bradyrhizobium sp.]|uniref:cyclic nucleotide-gated ion channel n=1 Tax=Bradyrhizobium sp. TaxID=376 RepID=UPI0025B93D0A|nr:cyclic nucleotide-gated ion channel [Bradyrhizobium sp.]